MTKEEYLKLQIGMYVSETKKATPSLVCSDFSLVKGFHNGGVILRPLLPDGTEAPEKGEYWEHHEDIELTRKMYASEFREKIAVG